MYVWKKGYHSALRVELADGKGNKLKVFVFVKEYLDVIFIFIRQNCASGIHKCAADLEII